MGESTASGPCGDSSNVPFTVRERVTEWQPGERMTYELLDGMNAHGYRATASLEDAPGGGTIVRWSSQWESADPITAFLLRAAAKDTVKRLARLPICTPTYDGNVSVLAGTLTNSATMWSPIAEGPRGRGPARTRRAGTGRRS